MSDVHALSISSSDDLIHEVRVVGPEEAGRMLSRVRNIAPLDQRQISTYARDMAGGMWKLNGDPLIFDDQGVLLSGRLRLHACIRSSIEFPTLIVRNVDPNHFDSIDAVRRRTAADVMSIRREKDGRALAAALAVLWRFSNDDFPAISKRISPQALVALLEENPDIRLSLEIAKGASPRVPHGLGAAMHYLFSRVDPSKADAFFADLGKEDLDSRAATASLKRQLASSLETGGMRNQAQLAGLTIKAWEAYRTGREISFVRYVPGTDQFPKISGLVGGVRPGGIEQSAAITAPGEALRELAVHVQIVTPERAQQFLDRNDRNRAIAGGVVDKYARDMKSGAWVLNGQTIKIGAGGRLLDGQHRCAAAIKANVTFPCIVVEGLDEAVFDTFDVGSRRSITAILKDRGETNTAVLGAVLRHVWLLEKELITVRNTPPTISELLDTLEKHPGVRESVKCSNKIRDIAPSVVLALHYYFGKVSQEKADEFIDRLGDGVMLGVDHPVLKLREIFIDNRMNKKAKLGDTEKAALSIKAWNNFLFGRPVRLLKWQTVGIRKESFPSIAGLEQGLAA